MYRHIEKIFQGEYLPPVPGFFTECTVLDVGANVGAFSFWLLRKMANQNWCNPTVHCYEPMSKNFEELKVNLGSEARVTLHNVAVGTEAGKRTLFMGKNNPGECSLFKGDEQLADQTQEVEVINAATLPKADILKLDTEGAEVEILGGYVRDAGNRPTWILMEFHGEDRRHAVDVILHDAGYLLVKCSVDRPGRGVSFYLLKDSFPAVYKQAYTD
jgi:FkbM family methyltransferase